MKKLLLCYNTFILLFFNAIAGITPEFSMESMQNAFVENKGQVKDQYGLVNKDVKYIYCSKLFNFQLTQQGFSYQLFKVTKSPSEFAESGEETQRKFDNDESAGEVTVASSRVDVILKGANSFFQIKTGKETGAYCNYYLNASPGGEITNIRSFNEVVYENVYDGIDLIFTASDDDDMLKYEFIVHPGANPKQIRLEYHGMSNLEIDNNGDLKIENLLGEIRETDLNCYLLQNKQIVPHKLLLHGNTVSFDLKAVKNQALVIDPNIVWGTYYGGNGEEKHHTEIAIDSKNNVYLVGTTASTTGIATTGAYQTIYGGGPSDFCIAKFQSTNKILWATYFGGTGYDYAYGIAIDNKKNVIVAGISYSSNITTPGAYQTINNGNGDVLIAKFTQAGLLTWSTLYGGSETEEALGVCIDKANNIFISGYTESANAISTAGTHQQIYGGGGDAFLSEFSPTGFLRWGTYYSGTGQDRAHSITLDGLGSVYIDGTSGSSSGIATTGAHQTLFGGNTDGFLAKFDTSTGNLFWGTYYGGSSDERVRGLVTDGAGNVYMGGSTHSSNNISSPNAYDTQFHTGGGLLYDAFVAKFTPAGHRIWGTYYGGAGDDYSQALTIDSLANIYFGGQTTSSADIASANAFQPNYAAAKDGFMVKMDSADHRLMGTYLGGTNGDELYDLATDNIGFTYIVLWSAGHAWPVTTGAYQLQNNGNTDYILYKFSSSDNCYDPNEPNNTQPGSKLIKTTTDSLTFGLNGNISSATDQDWFKVKLVAGMTNLKIQLRDVTKNYTLRLFDKNLVNVKTVVGSGSGGITLVYNNTATGRFFIEISGDATNYDVVNCYRINLVVSGTPFKQSNPDLLSEENNLIIYPNPISDQINLNLFGLSPGKGDVTIYNVYNIPVLKEEFEVIEGINSRVMDVQHLPDGPYFVVFKQGDNSCTRKIMISK